MNVFQRAETVQSAVERYERLMWEKARIEREIIETKIWIDRLGEEEKKNFSRGVGAYKI
jgi:hypothetical protein